MGILASLTSTKGLLALGAVTVSVGGGYYVAKRAGLLGGGSSGGGAPVFGGGGGSIPGFRGGGGFGPGGRGPPEEPPEEAPVEEEEEEVVHGSEDDTTPYTVTAEERDDTGAGATKIVGQMLNAFGDVSHVDDFPNDQQQSQRVGGTGDIEASDGDVDLSGESKYDLSDWGGNDYDAADNDYSAPDPNNTFEKDQRASMRVGGSGDASASDGEGYVPRGSPDAGTTNRRGFSRQARKLANAAGRRAHPRTRGVGSTSNNDDDDENTRTRSQWATSFAR